MKRVIFEACNDLELWRHERPPWFLGQQSDFARDQSSEGASLFQKFPFAKFVQAPDKKLNSINSID
jgi:hypothetical protein